MSALIRLPVGTYKCILVYAALVQCSSLFCLVLVSAVVVNLPTTGWFAPSSSTMLVEGCCIHAISGPQESRKDCDGVGVRGCEGVALSGMLLPSPLGEAPWPLGNKNKWLPQQPS